MQPSGAGVLYDAAAHHALASDLAWDESLVRRTIGDIVARTVAHHEAAGAWPAHPLDPGFVSGLYLGDAGVVWALEQLAARGHATHSLDGAAILRKEMERIASGEEGAGPHPENASWMFGKMPHLLLLSRLDPRDDTADELHAEVLRNDGQVVRELMWGLPGSMLASVFMHRQTGEARWRDAFRLQAEQLLAAREESSEILMWTTDVYGRETRFLGAMHGLSGNLVPLIQGRDLLDDDTWSDVVRGAMRAIVTSALREDGLTNWPTVWVEKQGRLPALQLCHGAPGIVASLAGLPSGLDQEFDQALLEGAELTWTAGALSKGSGLCHGTAGNGLALLAMFSRTGDEVWLERARAFAMESCRQHAEALEEHGRPRWNLWTGDLGLACYLANCIEGRAGVPTFDVF